MNQKQNINYRLIYNDMLVYNENLSKLCINIVISGLKNAIINNM